MNAGTSGRVSRQMVRAMWSGDASEEEARAFLQTRIAFLFKLMFWSMVALLAFLAALYAIDEANAPARRYEVYLISSIGLGGMAFIWRVWLIQPKPLSSTMMYRLDLVYSLGIGTAFGAAAYLQNDLRASGYLSVVYSTLTVFARALIVPSSGKRTAVASSITMLPMTAAALALAIERAQDVPRDVFFIGYMLFCIVPIVMSSYGSQIIYGLRQKEAAAKQLGAYTLDRKIGEGGMGVVHLAHHVMLRRPTAIKQLLPDRVGPDNLARFEREVQHMSQLTHPNTVAIYDYGRSHDGIFYYAMEYLGGCVDLQRLVTKHGPQPSGRVAQILAQVCGALHEAHTNQIIHRDIKPANIILCERGGMPDVAKVVDYGLVKEFAAETGSSTQVVLGTPAYLSPEAVTDPRSIGPGADIYALGAVGYFLLTGQKVFDGKTAVEVCIAHVTKAPRPPSEVAKQPIAAPLEAIILKCLAKKPEDRYASVIELRSALLAVPAIDWSVAQARQWWGEFRAVEQSVSDASDGATLTLDLEHHRGAFPVSS
ncbi:MAG TPA: serine/threonine-protein kinase [Kofleriaceae bacterium]|nr:serine/threonine-protein kinase [Kofleriaceae bacterium]